MSDLHKTSDDNQFANIIGQALGDNPDVKVKALKTLPLFLAGGGALGVLGSALAARRPEKADDVEENDKRYLSDAIQLKKYSEEDKQSSSGLVEDLRNLASNTASATGDWIGNAANTTSKTVVNPIIAGLSGAHATQPWEHPLFIPSAAALTAGGLYGGNVLGRKLFQGVRRDRREEEKARARQEYEEALAAFSKSSKEASDSDNTMANSLERLYQHFGAEKSAADEPSNLRHLGTLAGLYLTALGGLGVGGAIKGYKNQRRYDDMRKIEQAAKLEQLENQDQLNPTRIEYVQ